MNNQTEFDLLNGPNVTRKRAKRPMSLLLFFILSGALCLIGIASLVKAMELQRRFKAQNEKELTQRNDEYTKRLKTLQKFEAEAELARTKTDAQLALLRTVLTDRALAEIRAAILMLNRLLKEQREFSNKLSEVTTNEVAKVVAHDPDRSLEFQGVLSGAEKLSTEAKITNQLQALASLEEAIRAGSFKAGRDEQVAAQKWADWAEQQLKDIGDLQKHLASSTAPKPVQAPPQTYTHPTTRTPIRYIHSGVKYQLNFR